MKQLMQVLYVTEENARLTLEGDSVAICVEDRKCATVPLHNLERIISFSYMPISPALMDACAEKQIGLIVMSQYGRIRYQVIGETRGNVLLRVQQYHTAELESLRLELAKQFLRNKLQSQRMVLDRFRHNHPERMLSLFSEASEQLNQLAEQLKQEETIRNLMGVEGVAAQIYFACFDDMILSEERAFRFEHRSRRPPENACNAMLSFAYTLLSTESIGALESVGLDPYVGMLHQERAGKPALALDLMEEFRPWIADRFVLRLINLHMMSPEMFYSMTEGGVCMTKIGRTVFLREWNRMRMHTQKNTGIAPGLQLYIQANRLSRVLRGEQMEFTGAGWG